MTDMDFDEIEDTLDIIVPDVYRMFIEAVDSFGYDLGKYGIYDNTDWLVTGNLKIRLWLAESEPRWEERYFDFGVGDGCGNHFFLETSTPDSTAIQLWAHDPPGIEHVSSPESFFTALLEELRLDFSGPQAVRFDGTGFASRSLAGEDG